jgi:hypothetical protein
MNSLQNATVTALVFMFGEAFIFMLFVWRFHMCFLATCVQTCCCDLRHRMRVSGMFLLQRERVYHTKTSDTFCRVWR